MKARDNVGNQIVYLDYVLEGGASELDAELLRPIWNNLQYLASDPSTPFDVRQLAGETEAMLWRWIQLGAKLSRDSLERVRMDLQGVLKALKQSALNAGPFPAGAV